ncbi:MAG TPA: L,D-transpeptidase [Longimicrobiaceae bacterium]|nr:L,D-transpeptidase [Longimicrobiaceae bacterium]
MESYFRPIASLAALAGALLTAGSPATAQDEPLRLSVDISERTLYVWGGNVEPREYPVAVGTSEHPTPKGSFTIEKIIWNPAWVPPPNAEWAEDEERQEPGDPDNPMKAVKIFFDQPDYYIHGTGATESLGTAASHGCVRMDPDDAEELARILMEHGGESRSSGWYQTVSNDHKTRTVRLDDPIRFTVAP